MTLFLANTHNLSSLRYSSLSPRLQRSPTSSSQFPTTWKRLRHRNVFQCCAVTFDNGGLEESNDGAQSNFVAATVNSAAPDQKRATQAGTVAISSDSGLRGEEAQTAGEKPWVVLTESRIERAIFDFRFLTLMAIGGSLVGSLLCFLKGCGYICDSYIAYFGMCLNGFHTGKVILRLVEAVEVYLVGTVMLIFGMGLFGLFISNESKEGQYDRALKNTSLFGMFALTKRPLWMKITSLDTLKTKLGHCIVMILLVKLFELSKTVCIASSVDLLLYSVAIFLAAGSLYVLQQLHASH